MLSLPNILLKGVLKYTLYSCVQMSH